MALTPNQKKEIYQLLEHWLLTKIEEYSRETSYMPFFQRIIQDENITRMYSFSISIATSLGQSIYEQVGKIAARETFDISERAWKANLQVSKNRKQKIEDIVDGLRNGTRTVNKQHEIEEILRIDNGEKVDVKDGRTVDLYLKKGSEEYYFEIKTVKPNIDIFTKTKHKLLTWVARADKPIISCIVFPYNPYHPEPYQRFTQQGVINEEEIMVGKDFWDFLGGTGTYEEILEIFDAVGKKHYKKIKEKIIGKQN